MFPYIVIDIVIVLALVLFAWRGAKKGLILTLFGMLGLVVAIFGARFLSNTLHEPVADIIEPGIYQAVSDMEEQALSSIDLDLDLDTSVDGLVELLREKNLFPGLVDILSQTVESEDIVDAIGHSAAESLSTYLADLFARLILFVLSFVVILLLWFLISRTLDLAFKLPILNAVNLVGGLVLGLLKAIIIVVILVWVGQLLNWIPADPPTPVLSLFTPGGLRETLNKLVF